MSTSPWHRPQVAAMFFRATFEAGLFPFLISWLPWQSMHVAAAVFPFRTDRAWTLFS
jgi:hypothetical protein